MDKGKRKILVMVTALIMFFPAAYVIAANSGKGALKLEGAWVARVTSLDGEPGAYPFQWSYVLIPDASGKSAAVYGTANPGLPEFAVLPTDYASPIFGEIVMTGPDTTAFDSYFYGIKKVPVEAGNPYYDSNIYSSYDQLVYIGRCWGTSVRIGPDEIEVTDNFEFYLPGADGDGDGYPDPGSTPIITSTATTLDTRVPFPIE